MIFSCFSSFLVGFLALGSIVSTATATSTTATNATGSACLNNISNNTIAFFRGAPITFSYHVPTYSACAAQCEDLEHCRTWLYIGQGGGDCQLYKDSALGVASVPNFLYGVCGSTSSSDNSNDSPAWNSTASASNETAPLGEHTKREADFMRHKRNRIHHRHHS